MKWGAISGLVVERWYDLMYSRITLATELGEYNKWDKSERRETCQRDITENWERYYSLYQTGMNEDGKRCSDSGYVLKTVPT